MIEKVNMKSVIFAVVLGIGLILFIYSGNTILKEGVPRQSLFKEVGVEQNE